jgi:hypothetical protein
MAKKPESHSGACGLTVIGNVPKKHNFQQRNNSVVLKTALNCCAYLKLTLTIRQ